MARLVTKLSLVAALPLLLAAAAGKVITMRGKVTLDNGQPVAGAEIIIKDSWAGFLSMRERELMRVVTDAKGDFYVKDLRYRHTLDLLVPERECALATNGVVVPENRGSDGIYNVKIVLPRKKKCMT